MSRFDGANTWNRVCPNIGLHEKRISLCHFFCVSGRTIFFKKVSVSFGSVPSFPDFLSHMAHSSSILNKKKVQNENQLFLIELKLGGAETSKNHDFRTNLRRGWSDFYFSKNHHLVTCVLRKTYFQFLNQD